MSETAAHDHELEILEDDQNVPPRPEEEIADARDDDTAAPAVERGLRPDPGCAPAPDAARAVPRSQDAGGGPERWTAADRPAYGEAVRAVSLLLLCRDEA